MDVNGCSCALCCGACVLCVCESSSFYFSLLCVCVVWQSLGRCLLPLLSPFSLSHPSHWSALIPSLSSLLTYMHPYTPSPTRPRPLLPLTSASSSTRADALALCILCEIVLEPHGEHAGAQHEQSHGPKPCHQPGLPHPRVPVATQWAFWNHSRPSRRRFKVRNPFFYTSAATQMTPHGMAGSVVLTTAFACRPPIKWDLTSAPT